MKWYYIVLIAILIILLLIVLTSYICFIITFHVNRKKKNKIEFELPVGDIYDQYKEIIIEGINKARSLPYQEFQTKSFDGLNLYGKYYEYKKNAPIEILFHGYRGNAERDLSIGIERCFKLNHNVLLVDQRCSGKSGGNVISFGINERKDCLSWINYLINHFGDDVKIIIGGISMGGATVLMASSMNLPKNVIGVLADCPYSSQKDIIQKYIKDMHLPVAIFYPFVKLGAKIFGKFSLEETTPIKSIKKTNLPIILYHGDKDSFVPHYMSEDLYNNCNSKKKIVIINEAEHGIAYIVNPKKYISELENFFD